MTSSASNCSLAHRVTTSQNLYDSTWCRAGIGPWLGAADRLFCGGSPAFFVLHGRREALGMSYDLAEHLHRGFLLSETEQQLAIAVAGLEAYEYRDQLAEHRQRGVSFPARFQDARVEQPYLEGPHLGCVGLQLIEHRTGLVPISSFDRCARQAEEDGSVRRVRALEAA